MHPFRPPAAVSVAGVRRTSVAALWALAGTACAVPGALLLSGSVAVYAQDRWGLGCYGLSRAEAPDRVCDNMPLVGATFVGGLLVSAVVLVTGLVLLLHRRVSVPQGPLRLVAVSGSGVLLAQLPFALTRDEQSWGGGFSQSLAVAGAVGGLVTLWAVTVRARDTVLAVVCLGDAGLCLATSSGRMFGFATSLLVSAVLGIALALTGVAAAAHSTRGPSATAPAA
jgi:hypothetical protein